jgi:hypothetical protein
MLTGVQLRLRTLRQRAKVSQATLAHFQLLQVQLLQVDYSQAASLLPFADVDVGTTKGQSRKK